MWIGVHNYYYYYYCWEVVKIILYDCFGLYVNDRYYESFYVHLYTVFSCSKFIQPYTKLKFKLTYAMPMVHHYTVYTHIYLWLWKCISIYSYICLCTMYSMCAFKCEKNVVHCASTMAIFNVQILSSFYIFKMDFIMFVRDSNSLLKHIYYVDCK